MPCKNCGADLAETQEQLTSLRERKQKLEDELWELDEKIQALEAGYCGTYCQSLAEDGE